VAKTKKAKAKAKKTDPIEDLEAEIDADLGNEFEFEDGDSDESSSLMGQTVTFENDDGKTITGKVVEEDGNDLVVEDDEAFWETTRKIVEVEKKTPAKKPAKGEETPKAPAKEKKTEGKAAKKATRDPAAKTEKKDEPKDGRPRRMLALDAIKVPKSMARDVDKDGTKYKQMLADFKKRKQRDSIKVQTFGNPILVDGLHRLRIAEDLKWKEIECQEDDQVEDADSRLWNGLLDNETRKAMHWTELAATFARLLKSEEYTQRKIARALGISGSDVSKMVSALGLPKKILQIARDQAHNGVYSKSVFLELATAEKKALKEATTIMEESKPLTVTDVKNLKKLDKKDGKPEKRGGRRGDGAQSATRRSLSHSDIGDWLTIVVHTDHVEFKAHIEWENKTFRNFDPIKEIKELIEFAYQDKDLSIDSLKALQKALNAAKAELA